MKPKQYEIILVNLDPTIGSEIKKTRPCAIISPDDINRQLNTVIIPNKNLYQISQYPWLDCT
jgi:mRNA interferase MazF